MLISCPLQSMITPSRFDRDRPRSSDTKQARVQCECEGSVSRVAPLANALRCLDLRR